MSDSHFPRNLFRRSSAGRGKQGSDGQTGAAMNPSSGQVLRGEDALTNLLAYLHLDTTETSPASYAALTTLPPSTSAGLVLHRFLAGAFACPDRQASWLHQAERRLFETMAGASQTVVPAGDAAAARLHESRRHLGREFLLSWVPAGDAVRWNAGEHKLDEVEDAAAAVSGDDALVAFGQELARFRRATAVGQMLPPSEAARALQHPLVGAIVRAHLPESRPGAGEPALTPAQTVAVWLRFLARAVPGRFGEAEAKVNYYDGRCMQATEPGFEAGPVIALLPVMVYELIRYWEESRKGMP